MNGLYIAGTGRSVPSKQVSNEMISHYVDTSDEWITTRTGIKQRYFCTKEETNTSLAVQAAKRAIEDAGIHLQEIGICIAATFTADYAMPSLACTVHGALGLEDTVPAFDVNAACTGFITALETARCFLMGGTLRAKYALVIGSEVTSRMLDLSDRNTCVLFGDGAGAVVVRLSDEHAYTCQLGSHGDASLLYAGGANQEKPVIQMDGKAVFRFACETVPVCITQILERAKLTLDDVQHIVCHQANGRIIDTICKRLKGNPQQFYKNMQQYANTSAASIPIALDEMRKNHLLQCGERVICVGFGAGLTWGGCLLTF